MINLIYHDFYNLDIIIRTSITTQLVNSYCCRSIKNIAYDAKMKITSSFSIKWMVDHYHHHSKV